MANLARDQLTFTTPWQTIASAAVIATLSLIARAPAANLTLQNESLKVSIDETNGSFTIEAAGGQKPVITSGKLTGVNGSAKKTTASDPVFGQGEAVEIGGENGAAGRVAVFPKLPFALVRLTLSNAGNDAQIINKVPVVSFNVSLDKPVSALKTMGTGGLADASKPAGSYVWLAVADPETRHGVVAAWLTHDRASGVLIPNSDNDSLSVEARDDYGRLRILPGKTAETETVAIGYFDDARVGLEQWADAVAKHYDIHLKPQPSGYCTWYAEKHGGAADEKSLGELTEFAAKNLEPFGFSFLQIDDHWQLGTRQGSSPKKNFSAADPKGPYPTGMKATADNIKAHGLIPGIWFMPFAGTATDPWFADKQDLFVKDDQGRIYDCTWGGNSLDMTNPKAQAYLRSIVERIARDWGYTYFKMDGLYTGIAARQNYVNDAYKEEKYKEPNENQARPAAFGDAVLFDPDKTNVEAYRDGMKLVRDAAGPDVFFLGCNMAQNMRMFGASFGLFDAMRVGPDNKGNWTGWSRSPVAGSREYFLNGRIWYNDPDPQYVRAGGSSDTTEEPNAAARGTKNAGIATEDAKTIASWHTISGGLNTVSDWLPDLPAERLNILRRTMPAHGKVARPLDYFESDPPRVWTVTDDKAEVRRDVVAIFNWSDEQTAIVVPVAKLGLPAAASYAAFDYWGDKFLAPVQDSIKAKLPKHGCLVLSIRPTVDRPQLLGTSRHVTQGMTDVIEERWDAATNTLSGKTAVVGGDPDELRIAVPAGWKALSASGPDGAIELNEQDATHGVRAKLMSQNNRAIEWRIVFAQPG